MFWSTEADLIGLSARQKTFPRLDDSWNRRFCPSEGLPTIKFCNFLTKQMKERYANRSTFEDYLVSLPDHRKEAVEGPSSICGTASRL